ncbi:MAG TPA: Ppx/GppA family phosphatase, partial [bacterium]|nr:Ppx/GppA family phosphatase [bacterium]
DDEARITYTATRHEFDDLPDHYLVMDIGGGSTEFIYGNGLESSFAVSVNIGSVRLTEQFISGDPPDPPDLERIRNQIRSRLKEDLGSLCLSPDHTTLIGVAGTVTTLLAVEKQMEEYIPEHIHRQPMTFAQVEWVLALFASLPYEQRKELPGLQPQRADVIIAGTLILLETMDYFGFSRLLVSDRGVRYGLIYEYLESVRNGEDK